MRTFLTITCDTGFKGPQVPNAQDAQKEVSMSRSDILARKEEVTKAFVKDLLSQFSFYHEANAFLVREKMFDLAGQGGRVWQEYQKKA